ncbi:hypothetical protein Xbud_01289 [Xenorhabdus budapestensis]|uniref:Uncharacterized protein n=1 Tax=Xenorhabdus budapestensis TaxID=290110 RepID=A0A2D0J2V9_XENBU|nr:hypothetical protein Xbud_01289 [Xenorhabdus budapestensis]
MELIKIECPIPIYLTNYYFITLTLSLFIGLLYLKPDKKYCLNILIHVLCMSCIALQSNEKSKKKYF